MSRLPNRSDLMRMLVCAAGLVACSSGDGLVQPSSVSPIAAGPTTVHVGILGLQQDIAWARSLPRNSDNALLLSNLEGALQQLLGGADTPHTHGTSGARFDFSPGDVGGSGSIYYSYTDTNGMRWLNDFAYTTCNQGSGVVAKLEMAGTFYRFSDNAVIGPFVMWNPNVSGPNYISNGPQLGIGGPTVRAHAHNKHTCQIGDPQSYPFIYSDPETIA